MYPIAILLELTAFFTSSSEASCLGGMALPDREFCAQMSLSCCALLRRTALSNAARVGSSAGNSSSLIVRPQLHDFVPRRSYEPTSLLVRIAGFLRFAMLARS